MAYRQFMSRFRWTLRLKILLGQGVVLLLLAVICVFAVLRMERLGQASAAILSENYRSILAAENMIDALERQDSAVLLILLGRSDEGARQFLDNEARFLRWYSRARDNVTIGDEVEVLDRIEGSYREYLASYGVIRAVASGSGDEAMNLYLEGMLPHFEGVRNASVRLRRINESAMFEASGRAERLGRTGVLSLAVIGGSVVVFGVVFSLFLATLLARPIRRLLGATRRIAAGDYDVEVAVERSDEIGHLAREFNGMVDQLRAYRAMNVERMVAEKQRSEAILQSIDDGLILLDQTLMVHRMNPSAERSFGIGHEAARGRHLLEIVRDESMVEAVEGVIGRGTSDEEGTAEDILEIREADEARFYQYSVTPVTLESGSRIGVVVVLRDVTKLRQLDRLKSEFVMTASHELRTPLTSIEMSLDLLAERSNDAMASREKELLESTREDVQRLERLVENLLDLTKIEAGRIELEIVPVPVRGILGDLLADFGLQFEEKGVDLRIQMPGEALLVQADPQKIEWVLTNLLSNALRYTQPGGRVEVDADRIGPWASICVGDTGEGIPPEQQSRIFDQFVQLDSPHGAGGAGLGLAISREIVRAHGGVIWVDSKPGEGSLFTFTLPAVGHDGDRRRDVQDVPPLIDVLSRPGR